MKFALALAAALCTSAALLAQPNANAKVTTAVIAYNEQRFQEAIDKLNEALLSEAELKPDNKAKAYYYLCDSYLALCQDGTYIQANPESGLKAQDAWEKTLANDAKAKYKKSEPIVMMRMYPALYNAGLTFYNKQDYKRANEAFAKAEKTNPDNYQIPLMTGYACFMAKDTLGAVAAWERVLTLNEKDTTAAARKDTTLASVYQDLANMYIVKSKDSRKALELVKRGKTRFPTDENLQRTALRIYLENPQMYQEAKKSFEEALAQNPNALDIKAAFAELLENNNEKATAEKLYAEILAKDANNLPANYAMARKYVNEAKELLDKINTDNGPYEQKKAMQTQAQDLLRKGFPYLQNLNRLEPDNLEWLSQLATVADFLAMPDAAEYQKRYQAAKNK